MAFVAASISSRSRLRTAIAAAVKKGATGACLNSIDTGSQVSSLLWSKNKRVLLSSYATMLNQLILWKYPSMDKIAKLNGDVSGVLFTAESPIGCTVATAGDEMLMFWNVFGTPKITKPAKRTENAALFSGWMTQSDEDYEKTYLYKNVVFSVFCGIRKEGKSFEGLCRHALNVQIFLKMHRSDYAKKQLKMMQQIDEDYTLTQLANAWLDVAVEAHPIFQDFSEKYQQTGMILNGKAVCCMHMGRFEEAESLLLEALNRAIFDLS